MARKTRNPEIKKSRKQESLKHENIKTLKHLNTTNNEQQTKNMVV
jgi:hypothetical protein